MLLMTALAVITWSLENILIAVVVIAAAIGLVMVAVKQFGVTVPAWVIQVFWIVVVTFVVITALRFVFTL